MQAGSDIRVLIPDKPALSNLTGQPKDRQMAQAGAAIDALRNKPDRLESRLSPARGLPARHFLKIAFENPPNLPEHALFPLRRGDRVDECA